MKLACRLCVHKPIFKRSQTQKEQTRSRGHRICAQGVRSMRQVINATQCFALFLASSEILAVVTVLWGPGARISFKDCVINQPGNERGYWHADWPHNQTNAGHVPAPYPDVILHLSTIRMLTDFSAENGGNLGSARQPSNRPEFV